VQHATTRAAAHCPSLANKQITAHTMRHTAAMRLLHAGVDVTVIALWLGHEQIATTNIYLHADMQIKERALARTTPPNSTPGRYLQSLRDRFRGEDLADMLCCLRLHGELALRAKGILLLRESGMDEPPIDVETRDKLAELVQLERAIGKAGMLALRPLMMVTGKDIWQLTLLGR